MPINNTTYPNLDYRKSLGDNEYRFDPTQTIEYTVNGTTYEIHWYGAYVSTYGEIHDYVINSFPRAELRALFEFVHQHFELLYLSAHPDYETGEVDNPTTVSFAVREPRSKDSLRSIPPPVFNADNIG